MRRQEVIDVYHSWQQHAELFHPAEYEKYKHYFKRYAI